MPTLKLTRKAVSSIQPLEKPVIFYDEDLKGFGLKVMPSGTRTWIIEYRPGAGGRGVAKKRIKIGTPATHSPEAARDEAARTLARVTLGADPAAQRAEERTAPSVKEVLKWFLQKHVEAKRKGSTADFYRHVIEKHINPEIGSMRAAQVTKADVARMQAAISRRRDGKTGGKTIANRALAILSAAYGWAAGEGLVPEGCNPVSRVERYVENSKERYLTSEELAALGEALIEAETVGVPYAVDETKAKAKHAPKAESRRVIFSPAVTAAIRLLVLTGCRLREILHLTWREVDLERGLLFLGDSKTGKKTVVLSSAAIAIIKAIPRIGVYVIASESAGTKEEKPRADLKRPWSAISKRAGLDGVRLHDLRHTFASIGAGSGLGLPIIGRLLGHADSKTTEKYAHLASDPVRRSADIIADRITAAMGGS
ncbi:site-specific recombinase XerD [Rhizobium sp. PP-CC-2G-626]|nr:site-specific recombinase XerD [Rhizobium sp. PP-CC-2G-626]